MRGSVSRRGIGAIAAAAVVLAGSLGGCVFSLEDVTAGDDGGADATASGDGGDGGVLSDGATDDVFACTSSGPEDCTNGKDDDCNGMTDCDDPACSAFQCVAPAPAGWSPVFVAASTPDAGCPGSGTSAPIDVLRADASAACTCSCAPQGGACAGALTFYAANGGACPATASTSGALATTCVDLANALNGTSSLRIDQPAGPTSCAPSLGTPTAPAAGSVCTPASGGDPTGKCANGSNVCARKAPAPFARCVSAPADAGACPAGYPNRFLAGDTANDGRTCAGCACATVPCVSKVDVFSHTACQMGVDYTQVPDGGCQAIAGNVNMRSYQSTFGSGCQITDAATMTGTLTFTSPRVVCCL